MATYAAGLLHTEVPSVGAYASETVGNAFYVTQDAQVVGGWMYMNAARNMRARIWNYLAGTAVGGYVDFVTINGWTHFTFGTPIPVAANTLYIVSYWCRDGGAYEAEDANWYTAAAAHHALYPNYVDGSGFVNGILRMPVQGANACGVTGINQGTYNGGNGDTNCPLVGTGGSNYWIEPEISDAGAPAPITITRSPTTNGTVYNQWSTPTNVASSDNSLATCAAARSTTHNHDWGGFDVSAIPDTATLNKVEVLIEESQSSTSTSYSLYWLLRLGTTEGAATLFARVTADTLRTLDVTAARPGGGTWSKADLAALKVVLRDTTGNTSTAATYRCDYLALRVTYTETVPSVAGAGSASGTGSATATGLVLTPAIGNAPGLGSGTLLATALTAGAGSGAGLGDDLATGTALTAGQGSSTGTGTAVATGTALTPVVEVPGQGSSTGTGAAQLSSLVRTPGQLAAAGQGSAAAAAGQVITPGLASGSGTGTGTALGRALTAAQAGASGTGSAGATGHAIVAGTGSQAGQGASSSTGLVRIPGQLSSSGQGAATLAGGVVTTGTASSPTIGAGSATGTVTTPATGSGAGLGGTTATASTRIPAAGVATGTGEARVGATTITTFGQGLSRGTGEAIATVPLEGTVFGRASSTGVGTDRLAGTVLTGSQGESAGRGSSPAAGTAITAGRGLGTGTGDTDTTGLVLVHGRGVSTGVGRAGIATTGEIAGTGLSASTGTSTATGRVTSAATGSSTGTGAAALAGTVRTRGCGLAAGTREDGARGLVLVPGTGAAIGTGRNAIRAYLETLARALAEGHGEDLLAGLVLTPGVGEGAGLGEALARGLLFRPASPPPELAVVLAGRGRALNVRARRDSPALVSTAGSSVRLAAASGRLEFDVGETTALEVKIG